MTDTPLSARAGQGDPAAIAALLNRSLQAQNLQAQVRRQHDQLLVSLSGSSGPPQQRTIVPRIVQGLQRLGVQGIRLVHIRAVDAEDSAVLWQTRTLLWTESATPAPTTTPLTSSAAYEGATEPASPPRSPTPTPENIDPASPAVDRGDAPPPIGAGRSIAPVEPSSHLILPGWSFWFGWGVMVFLGHSLGSGFGTRLFYIIHSNGYFTTFGEEALIYSLMGVGQWFVLRQDVSWAKQWLQATVIGAIATSLLQLLWLMLRRWEWSLPLPSVIVLVIEVALMAPLFWLQWRVLRRQLGEESASLWVRSVAVMTFLALFLQDLTPATLTPLRLDLRRLWSLGLWLGSGGVMVYLLRQSRLELLKLNRFTDANTRRRLLQQRASINGRFFLTWVGLTLAGWTVGAIASGLLAMATFGLSGLFSVAVFMGIGAAFQSIALQNRINQPGLWLKTTLSSAVGMTLIGLVLSLFFGGLALRSIAMSSAPGAGYWVYLSALGIGALSMALIWVAVITAQSRVLFTQGYRPTWWLLIHLGGLLTLGSDVFLQQAFAIWGLVLIWVLVPAATMVWLMGYPRTLHPQPGIWTHH